MGNSLFEKFKFLLQDIVRTIRCTDPSDPRVSLPLVELDEDVKCYQRAQVSAAPKGICAGANLLVSVALALLLLLRT